MLNYYFINKELLIRNEIAFECYDKKLTDSYSIAISDAAYPDKYRPISPIEAIRNSEKVIHFLTHPRHWRCSPLSSFKEDFTRLIEGLKYYKI